MYFSSVSLLCFWLVYRIRFIGQKKAYKSIFIIFNIIRSTLPIPYTGAAIRSSLKGLIKKNGTPRDTRASRDEGGRRTTHLYLAQPIRAGLSTVKTSTLTTGDHNRAYLFLSQARARARARAFSPSPSFSFLSLVAAPKAISPFAHLSPPWRAIADFIAKLWTDPEERRSRERKELRADR